MNKYDKKHLRNLNVYQQKIADLFAAAATDAAALSALIGTLGERPFSWQDYPLASVKMNDIVKRLNSELTLAIVNGVRSEWTLSNNKNNELCQQVFGEYSHSLPEEAARRYYSTNADALEAFIQRKNSATGLALSDNVWNYTNQFKNEIEMALDVGIRSGRSADELSRDVRDYLKYPDKLFRRVRDEHGQLQLSKAAKAFHPGRGVYRSSYMNARRLAATETNIAYRTADHLRWQQLDFVVGIEVHLSNNHNCKGVPTGMYVDICDELKGKYPKDFKFVGWHPHCRCYATSVLKTETEIAADNERIMAEEKPQEDSENTVTRLPRNYEDWVTNNADRILSAKSKPYFLTDNGEFTADGKYRVKDFDGRGMLTIKPTPKAQVGTITNSAGVQQEIVKQTLTFTQQKLNTLGWTFEENSGLLSGLEERWAEQGLGRLDFDKLDKDVTAIFGELGFTNINKMLIWMPDKGKTQVWFSTPWGEMRVVRTFTFADGKLSVEHSMFELAEELQGRGTSKKILNCFYDQYMRLGVNTINVHANLNVGGYTWCKYGFCATEKDVCNLLWQLKHRSTDFKDEWKQMSKVVADFYDSHDSSTLFPMNQLTEISNAKQMLAGSSWYGILDLTNPVQRKVFEHYLGR